MSTLHDDIRDILLQRHDERQFPKSSPFYLDETSLAAELEALGAHERVVAGLPGGPPVTPTDNRSVDQTVFDSVTHVASYDERDYAGVGVADPKDVALARALHLAPGFAPSILRSFADAAKEGASPAANTLFQYRGGGDRNLDAEQTARDAHVRAARDALNALGRTDLAKIAHNLPKTVIDLLLTTAGVNAIRRRRPA